MPVIYRQALKGGISVDSAFRVSNVKALGMKDGWNCFLRTKFQQSWHQHYGIILKIDLKKKIFYLPAKVRCLPATMGSSFVAWL